MAEMEHESIDTQQRDHREPDRIWTGRRAGGEEAARRRACERRHGERNLELPMQVIQEEDMREVCEAEQSLGVGGIDVRLAWRRQFAARLNRHSFDSRERRSQNANRAVSNHGLLRMVQMFLRLAFFLCSLAGGLAAAEDKATTPDAVLLLQRGDRPPIRIELAALRQQPAETLEVRWKRDDSVEAATFRGTPMRQLLNMLGIPAGGDLRGDWFTSVVTFVGADGFEVTLSLGELEPTVTGRRAIVAWERDGKPLGANEAPLRLVMEGDLRPSRSIRQLVSVRVSEPKIRQRPAAAK